MLSRPTYHITVSGDGWQLAPQGEPPIATDRDRAVLVERGMQIAQSVRAALVIFDSAGEIEEECTFL